MISTRIPRRFQDVYIFNGLAGAADFTSAHSERTTKLPPLPGLITIGHKWMLYISWFDNRTGAVHIHGPVETMECVTALPQAVDRLHELHRLPVLDVFFRLPRLSERAYKGHTAFISSSSSFSLLTLDFLVDSYIVVWILVRLLLSERVTIGRLAHKGNHGCWMPHFQAEVLTAQNITILLSRLI